jgi:hypothetical protein
MKLILENWKRYTHAILNEDLLIESYEDAYETIKKRSAKLLKGWAYDKSPDRYNQIEKNIQDAILDKLGSNPSQEEINKYTNAWELGGIVIANMINDKIIPNDITDKQKSIALLWNYKQLVKNSIVDLDSFLNMIVEYLAAHGYDIFLNFSGRHLDIPELRANFNLSFAYAYLADDPQSSESDIRRAKLIENFFHWNRFVEEGKKDLNSVSSYNELIELVKEAKPLFQAWQERQEQADADKGKEVLLDDKNWQIIVIHNKGAACQLGKGTDWCTAAPGLDYFKQYYKPDDPLFYILDKSDGERYQFHFGTQQFMDKDDYNLYPSRYHVGDEIMSVLAKVVPAKYDIARSYLNNVFYNGHIRRFM